MTKQITSTPERLAHHLDCAERIFQSWPEWKREAPATTFNGSYYCEEEPEMDESAGKLSDAIMKKVSDEIWKRIEAQVQRDMVNVLLRDFNFLLKSLKQCACSHKNIRASGIITSCDECGLQWPSGYHLDTQNVANHLLDKFNNGEY